MYNRFYNLPKIRLFFEKQLCFRDRHSTDHELLEVIDVNEEMKIVSFFYLNFCWLCWVFDTLD